MIEEESDREWGREREGRGEEGEERRSEMEIPFCKVSHYVTVGERKLWLGFQYLRCAKGAIEREVKRVTLSV